MHSQCIRAPKQLYAGPLIFCTEWSFVRETSKESSLMKVALKLLSGLSEALMFSAWKTTNTCNFGSDDTETLSDVICKVLGAEIVYLHHIL